MKGLKLVKTTHQFKGFAYEKKPKQTIKPAQINNISPDSPQ